LPTFERLARFRRDFERLTPEQQRVFLGVVRQFVADLRSGRLRPGLRVKGVRAAPSVFEMTWASDGRATFSYGNAVRPGHVHIVWRRVGTHDILRKP